jgi:hypothetical protein
MKFAAAVAGLALLFTVPALAQSATAPVAVEAATPAKLELARQMIDASGGRKQMENVIDSMYGAMFPKVAESLPKEAQGSMRAMQSSMKTQMHALMPSILEVTERVYAETFTEQEMRDMLAFQLSPSGQAVVRKTPLMMQRTMTEMVPVMMAAMPKVMHSVTGAVCEEQHCTADQRKTIEAAMNAALQAQGAPRS